MDPRFRFRRAFFKISDGKDGLYCLRDDNDFKIKILNLNFQNRKLMKANYIIPI